MSVFSDTFDLTSFGQRPERALSTALLLQQELASRLAFLALHTCKHPEMLPRFGELVQDLLCDLCCCEHDLYCDEALDALHRSGFGSPCAGEGIDCEPGLN